MAIAKGNWITSAQTITGDWVDVKDSGIGEKEVIGYSFLNTFIDLDINDSKNVEFRYRVLEVTEGNESPIPFLIIKNNRIEIDDVPFRVKNDIDQKLIIPVDLDQRYRILKLQIRALTVGSTAGQILTATYRQGYRQ